ncbi:MAG TPA: hypothetical protein VF591_11630 [Pyrinomonadaceae bacterium]|jgi:hypothetical protein
MRTLRVPSLLALALLTFASAQTARASAAAGSYQFTLTGEKYLKYVEFDATGRDDGTATGYIAMTDEAVITIQDVDGTGEKGRLVGYNFKADVDSLVVVENKAVLGAVIRSASDQSFIGQRVVFTFVDNGDNTRVPDSLTWGVYRPIDRTWVPSDAEWKEDPGVGLRWWATDAERRDDVGYEMPRDETLHGQTFPAATYDFVDADNTAGDIRVSP